MMRVTWLHYWTTKSIHPVSLTKNKRWLKYVWALIKHRLVQKVADSAQNVAYLMQGFTILTLRHILNFSKLKYAAAC
jgi:hypothetical protein